MDFQLSESQRALQDMARKFAREVIRPKAAHHDETAEFPREIIASAWENGLLNMALPESCGGLGMSHLDQLLAYEELAWGCAGMATSITANDLANLPIIVGATEEQKKRLLTPFSEKFKLASFCLTEPEAGSDVAGMSTTAVRDGDHYVLNGSKCFITNGGHADQYTVFATVDQGQEAQGDYVLRGRGPSQGPHRGQAREQDGPAGQRHRGAHLRGRARPGGQPHRRGGRGLAHRHGDAGQQPSHHRHPLGGHRPRRARVFPGVLRPAQDVRQAHPRAPGHPVHARRHGHEHPGRAPAVPPERLAAGRGPAGHACSPPTPSASPPTWP